jgi:diguanylate cyclase (GGDEF)-like protein/PAS domain S-box-containing protein
MRIRGWAGRALRKFLGAPIAVQVGAWLLLISIAPLLLVGSIAHHNLATQLRRDALGDLEAIAKSRGHAIEAYMRERQADIEVLTRSPLLAALAGPSAPTRAELEALRQHLASMVKAYHYAEIDVLDARGATSLRVCGGPHPSDRHRDAALAETFERVRAEREPLIAICRGEVPDGIHPALVAAPLVGADRTFAGAVVARIGGAGFDQAVNDYSGLGTTGELVLGCRHPRGVEFLSATRHDPEAAGTRLIAAGSRAGRPLLRAVSGRAGRGVAVDYRGRTVLAAWQPLPTLGWGLVAKIDRDEAMAPAAVLRGRLYLLFTAVALGLVAVAWSVARSIAGPVKGLVAAVRRARDRDLAGPVAESGPRELAALAREFNAMAVALDLSYHELERRAEAAQARLAAVVETTTDIVTISRPDGRLLHLNGAGRILLGVAPDEDISALSLMDFRPEGERTRFRESVIPRLLRTGTWSGESVLRTRDGHEVPVSVVEMVHRDAEGRVELISAILRDMTERHRAGEALRQRTRLAELTAEAAAVLTHDVPLRAMLDRCATSLVRHLDAALARIWTLDEAGQVLELQASAGLYTHIDGAHARIPVGQYKIGRIAQERRAHLTNDVHGDSRIHDQDWARREGMVAFAGYPLLLDGALLGVVAIFARRRLCEFERAALASLADMIALAIQRKRAEQALRRSESQFRSLGACSPAGIFMTDVDGQCTYTNPRCQAICGFTAEEAMGEGWSRFVHPDDVERVRARWLDDARHARESSIEYRFATPQNGVRWVHVRAAAMRSEAGGLIGFVGTVEDITERKQAQERLAFQATHDALTGLPNRALLRHRLQELTAAPEPDAPFALLLLDLDRFKEINDTFGHHHGDEVLQQLGPRLLAAVRETDLVARLGGDEFGIVLRDADRAQAVEIAGRVVDGLDVPIEVGGQELEIGVSIGIALYPEHGRDAATLLKRADVAMYAAKRAGAGHAVYADDQARFTPERIALMSELRRGIEDGQLELHFQPKFDLRTRTLAGAEALVRWRHPREGLLGPSEFLGLAAHAGLTRALDLSVLRSALAACRGWQLEGLTPNLAVNLDAATLQDEASSRAIIDLLAGACPAPSWLTLEVTEAAVMAEPARAGELLRRLHAMGVRIAIDDFGTGYSSLAYLKELPVDEVKVDRSFVRDMAGDAADACIVRAVIDLGHNLGLRVVAEGVEDRAAAELLRTWGCDLAQGYYFGRPQPADEFRAALLAARDARRAANGRPRPARGLPALAPAV